MRSTRARTLVVLAFFIAGAWAGWRQGPMTKPLTFDNQIYFYAAERMADGIPPHVSLVDHKHQLSVIVSGLSIRLGRLFGFNDVFAARIVSIAAAATTVACIASIGGVLSGSPVGAAIAGLTMLVFPGYFLQAAMGVRPKLFMATFMMLSLVAFARRRLLRAGFLAGGAFLCWQPAALVTGALMLATLTESARTRTRSLLRVAGGALAAIVLYELYFVSRGALAEQIRQSYLLPAHLGAYKYPGLVPSLSFIVNMGLGWRLDSSRLLPGAFLLMAAALLVWVAVRPRRTLATMRERPEWTGVVLCGYAALLFTLLTHEGYPDMFFLEPYIAVVLGASFTCASRAAAARTRPVVFATATLACAAWLLVLQQSRSSVFPARGTTLRDQYDLAKQVDLLLDDQGSVWAVGCPHLLALLRRENFLPYGLLIDQKVRAYMTRNAGPGEYQPLREGRPPAVILSARGGLRTVVPALRRDYQQIENRSFTRAGIQIWIRRPPRPGAPRPTRSAP